MSDDYLLLSDDSMLAIGMSGIHFTDARCSTNFNCSAEKHLSITAPARTYAIETTFKF